MKKIFFIVLSITVLAGCVRSIPVENAPAPMVKEPEAASGVAGVDPAGSLPPAAEVEPELITPLGQPEKRIRLKRFGDYITPKNSPVSPERFRGYHTGVDFEVFPEELNSAVEVKAACSGNILEKKWVSGYGGVVVTGCGLDGEDVTALYGHLDITSISATAGDIIETGQVLGRLGADNSRETDRERKHLHFSIHKGRAVDLRGYVPTEAALADWLDPCQYIECGG